MDKESIKMFFKTLLINIVTLSLELFLFTMLGLQFTFNQLTISFVVMASIIETFLIDYFIVRKL